MKVNTEILEGNKAKLTIEVPDDVFERSMDKVFRQIANRVNVRGFRKGKAPRNIVERMYGREILLEDAVNDAIPGAFSQAVADLGRKYECAVYPQYDVVSTEKGKGLVFTATYDLKPEVKLGKYMGMDLEKVVETISDDAVDRQINTTRERFARVDKIEGPAAVGDTCVIDFLGKVDGEPFEGGSGEAHPLVLGSNAFIPGFEDQLVGAMAGGEISVDVTFPAEYHAENLAGKAAVFDVTVKEIQRKVLSDLDDEFAKDVSEFETLAELRQDYENKLRGEADGRALADLENKAVTRAVEESEMELPEGMIAFRQDQLMDNFAKQIERQGVDLDSYFQYTQSSAESLREEFKDRAIRELKTELVLEAIADAEGLTVSDEDLEAEYQRLAGRTGRPVEEIKSLYDGNSSMLESLKFSLMMNLALKTLTDNAVITEVAPKPADEATEAVEADEAVEATEAVEADEAVETTEAVEAEADSDEKIASDE